MKGLRGRSLLASGAVAALVAGCPLPFDFNGKGAGDSLVQDPSSPNITAPVTFSYSVTGGGSGTVPDNGSFYAPATTTVTLATDTENAVIFYTDDGTALTNLSAAKRISASSGGITLTRTTSVITRDLHAVAVGPGMLPSPPVHATVGVSPYPVLTVTRSSAGINEDGGAATFAITRSGAAASDITVNLLTGGDYEALDVTGLPGGPATVFTATLVTTATTITIPITGQPDADGDNDTVTLSIEPGTDYTVGSPGSASIVVTDNHTPVLTITRDTGTIFDTAGAVQFTVTSTFASSSDLTVHLASGGTYEAGDVAGLPASGSVFTRTIPAGSSSVSWQVTASPDVGEYNDETVTVTIAANALYTVGSPGSASVSIADSSPVGTVTLTADRSTMVDGQSATFTVTTTAAPEVNLVVGISSSGYTPGKVTGLPASVTIPQGGSSATFVASAPSEANYPVQSPLVQIAAGAGYTPGSPDRQGLLITDNAFAFAGLWQFSGNGNSSAGGGQPFTLGAGAAFVGDSLRVSGAYPNATSTDITGLIDLDAFSLGVGFSMTSPPSGYWGRPIIATGFGWRWLILYADPSGSLQLHLNNHAVIIDLGSFTVTTGVDHAAIVNINRTSLAVTVWFDGQRYDTTLPAGFVWDTAGDMTLLDQDWSTGLSFDGLWRWVSLGPLF
jgi:hypothetical protein